MNPAGGEVTVRWLPGLGRSCPGGVDLTAPGPDGPIERAVSLPEALTLSVVADLLCPASNWYETIRSLAAAPTSCPGSHR
jgi:hypothetical protein